MVIALLPEDRTRRTFARLMAHSRWSVEYVSSVPEAAGLLKPGEPNIIVTQPVVAGRNWKHLLDGHTPVVVVASQVDERLWADVLSLGGYDMLVEPLDPKEVFRVLSLAWQNSARHPHCV